MSVSILEDCGIIFGMGLRMGHLTEFARLTRGQRSVILRALTMVPTVSRSLRQQGYHETRARLAARPAPSLRAEESIETAKRVDGAIRHLPWKVRCLERSLVVWWALGGAPAEVRLGVAPGNDGEEHRFHAWVEAGGSVLNDDADVASVFLPLSSSRVDSMSPADFN